MHVQMAVEVEGRGKDDFKCTTSTCGHMGSQDKVQSGHL